MTHGTNVRPGQHSCRLVSRPTLHYSEDPVSDTSPPESDGLSRVESSLSLEPPCVNSISRSSSERSGTSAGDVFVSPLGEPTEFLPVKVIAPEFQLDIQKLLVPVYEDYHRLMVREFPSASSSFLLLLCLFSVMMNEIFFQILTNQ